MSNNLINFKIEYVLLYLLFINPVNAKVNLQPGENLWWLTARVGDWVDDADSKLDLLGSQKNTMRESEAHIGVAVYF